MVIKMKKVDVIIPVYKPEKSFFELIDRLEHQTLEVNKIILMNTEQKYFDRFADGSSFFSKYTNICITHLPKKEFDHGKTRRQGVEKSDAPFFVLMTQDAMPKDKYLIERLTAPLESEDVAAAYARQMAEIGRAHV